MTVYPDDDPRFAKQNDPDVDPVASHAKRDIFDPDFQPESEAGDDRRGVGEKIGDAASNLAGKVKEGWGDLTDDERLEAEGRSQQAEAQRRQAADPKRGI